MAVPNTNTFTLQDVVDELGLVSEDLVACFAAAVDGDFNSTFKGSKDRLSNFRGYEVSTVTLTSFYSSGGSSSQTTACGQLDILTYYHDGSNSIPVVGDNVYSDSAGTIGLARNYYFAGIGTYHIQTGGTTVDAIDLCAF